MAADNPLRCPRCQSDRVSVQMVTNTVVKNRGCLGWLFWIILACLTFGLIIIIPLLTNSTTSSETRKIAVCQNCGNSWQLDEERSSCLGCLILLVIVAIVVLFVIGNK